MAITTSGHRLTNLARYTPIDPTLVAFDPSALGRGLLTGLQVGGTIDKIKSEREKEKELAATRAGRIKAENARNAAVAAGSEAEIPLFGPRADFELGQIGSRLKLLEPTTNAEVAKAKAAEADATASLNLSQEKQKVASAQLQQQLRELQVAEKLHADKTALLEQQVKDALANAKNDMELNRALQRLKVEKDKADIEFTKAHAKYYESGGRPSAEKDPAQQIRALAMAAKTIEEEYGLPAYEEENYDEDGKLKGGFLGFGKGVEDPNKEAARKIRDAYRRGISILLGRMGVDTLNDLGSEIAPSAAPAAQPNAVAPSKRTRFVFKDGKLITADE